MMCILVNKRKLNMKAIYCVGILAYMHSHLMTSVYTNKYTTIIEHIHTIILHYTIKYTTQHISYANLPLSTLGHLPL